MSQELWSEVDAFIERHLIASDDTLTAALAGSVAAGLPAIAVSPAQGALLALIARMHGARRILELGTLGGYSTILMARTLPADGRLVTLELRPEYAEVARANLARAGVEKLVEIRVGPAGASLAALAAEEVAPFDLVFIDADKQGTPAYFTAALAMTRPGGVIIVDNVVRGGSLVEAAEDAAAQAMRQFHELLGEQTGVSATTIQTVGSKGYDGFTLALLDA